MNSHFNTPGLLKMVEYVMDLFGNLLLSFVLVHFVN